MNRLYHVPLSPYCRKVRLVLAEKKIEVELIEERYWEQSAEFMRKFYPDAGVNEWNDWRWQNRNRIKTLDERIQNYRKDGTRTEAQIERMGRSLENTRSKCLKRCDVKRCDPRFRLRLRKVNLLS